MPASRSSAALVRFGRVLVVVAVCASLGLHWAALQAVAWTQMFVAYSQQASLGEAVEMTFSGEHPCDLCQLVKHGQSEEKKQEAVPLSKKLDAVLAGRQSFHFAAAEPGDFSVVEQWAMGWRETPPIPPPRG